MFLLIGLFYFIFVTSPALALELKLDEGVLDPLKVLIAVDSTQMGDQRLVSPISDLVKNDLENTGQFLVAVKEGLDVGHALSLAKSEHADGVVLLNWCQGAPTGKIKAQISIFDVPLGKIVLSRYLMIDRDHWRYLAHGIGDVAYEGMTGDKGFFNTRIAYISEEVVGGKRIKRLAIMDQDGYNHRYLSSGGMFVFSPKFSPDGKLLTYLSYSGLIPKVHILDLVRGVDSIVGSFPGMTFSPSFAPSGHVVVMSHADAGKSDIFLYDLPTHRSQRLTSGDSLNVSPSFSPDGQWIVFTSDRGGSPQLYIMRKDGSDVKRLSSGRGLYSAPTWSPRGDWIAFTKQIGHCFYIGILSPDGQKERILSMGYMEEGPVWAPNGRALLFSAEFRNAPGQSILMTVDISGRSLRVVQTPYFALDPAWSPYALS